MQFKRIKDLREDNDLLQKDIAGILGISQQYYSEYENGKRTITISHLITLAKYYDVSIDYLVGLSNFKDENKKRINLHKRTRLFVFILLYFAFPIKK